MHILADENFPLSSVEALREEGHDVRWVRTKCAGWKDADLLEYAEKQGRLILTLDRDFWQIALQLPKSLKHSGIVLFRVHPATSERLEPLLRAFVKADMPWIGHLSIISPEGIQMLPVGRS